MENAVFTTRKPNIFDRISGWFWRMRFKRQSKKRAKQNRLAADKFVAIQRVL